MKEQILDLIKQHFTAILVKSVRAEDLVSEQSLLNLATRLDKAIGIDREKVEQVVERNLWRISSKLFSKEREKKLAQAITQSRPLKCEVRDE